VSERNVDRHRRFTAAFNARDVEGAIALCDEQIEFHSLFAAVGGADYGGPDGMRRYFAEIDDAWGEELRIEPEAYFDLGEHTLAFYVAYGRGPQSGAEVRMPYAQVVRWRDGLVVYYKAYAQREDALRHLGVTEKQLEPIAP
jgi:ketosteroid isomerase-like protein